MNPARYTDDHRRLVWIVSSDSGLMFYPARSTGRAIERVLYIGAYWSREQAQAALDKYADLAGWERMAD